MNTSPESFTILVNPIDPQLMFIQHKDTGFYNLTKISETATYPNYLSVVKKCVYEFLQSDKADADEIKTNNNLDLAHYELCSECTSDQFAGVYAHKDLYENYLLWINIDYGIKMVKLRLEIAQRETEEVQRQVAEVRMRVAEVRMRVAEVRSQVAEVRTQVDGLEIITNHMRSRVNDIDSIQHMVSQRFNIHNSFEYVTDSEPESDIDYESSDDGLPPIMIARGFIQRRSFDEPNESEYDYDSDEDTDMDPTFESDDDSSDEEDDE